MKSIFDTVLMKPKQLEDLFTALLPVGVEIQHVSYNFSCSLGKSMWYATQDKIVNKIPIGSYRSSL